MKTSAVIWRIITYKPGLYLLDTFLWTAINLAWMVQAIWIKAFFDKLTGDAPVSLSFETIMMLILATAVAHIFFLTCGMIVDTRFRFYASTFMRRNLLKAIYRLPGAQALPQAPGEAISTFRDDVVELENTADWLIDTFAQVVSALFALIIMLRINPQITLLTVVPLSAILLVAQAMSNRVKKYRRASRQATEKVTGALNEILSSVQAIQLANAEGHVQTHFANLSGQRRTMVVKDRLLTQIIDSIMHNNAAIGTALILIVSAQAMLAGTFTVGDFALFVAYVQSLALFSTFIGHYITQLRQAGVSFDRMITLIRHKDEPDTAVAHTILNKTPIQLSGTLPSILQPTHTRADHLEQLEVKGLTFNYLSNSAPPTDYRSPNTDHPGITDISFTLTRSSFTVITGRIGSGKTTLLRTLLGLLPAEAGTVMWNGNQILNEQLAEFFVPPRTAYTPQIPTLLSTSVRQNLLLGLEKEEMALTTAVHQAVLEHDLKDMADGLETVVGPRGVRLSGGQVQRTAAARMFVRQPELLVFDDLSSALDVDTEKRLWERLFAHDGSATCLVVSHRRSALRRADQIIVLQNGRMADRGPLNELLSRSQEMQRLWQGNVD